MVIPSNLGTGRRESLKRPAARNAPIPRPRLRLSAGVNAACPPAPGSRFPLPALESGYAERRRDQIVQ